MDRIFHPWDKWEDFTYNFYGGVDSDFKKDTTLVLYANLLRDLAKFEAALQVITSTWVYSCEHNLTNESLNRIAYLGQAACALLYKVPHSLSMGGYNLLTDSEKKAADAMADRYLNIWLENHNKKAAA